jgi:hypothetical protein
VSVKIHKQAVGVTTMVVLWTVSNYKSRRWDDIKWHDDHKMERKSASFENGVMGHTEGHVMISRSLFRLLKSIKLRLLVQRRRRLEMSLTEEGISARRLAGLKTMGE